MTSVYTDVTALSIPQGWAWSDGPIPRIAEEGQGHTRTTALEVTPQLLEQGSYGAWGIGEFSCDGLQRRAAVSCKRNAGMQADVPANSGALTWAVFTTSFFHFFFFLPPTLFPYPHPRPLPPSAKGSFSGLAEVKIAKKRPP